MYNLRTANFQDNWLNNLIWDNQAPRQQQEF